MREFNYEFQFDAMGLLAKMLSFAFFVLAIYIIHDQKTEIKELNSKVEQMQEAMSKESNKAPAPHL